MPFRDARLDQELLLGGADPKVAEPVFGDLVAYLGRPIEDIAEEYWRYRTTDDVPAQERVARATDEAPVMAYYQSTPHYLYELSYWEASYDKQAWLRVVAKACRKYRLTRVLDYGGGVGGACLFLRAQGIACDYLDVAGKTYEYAAWRFQRRGVPIKMFDVLTGWPTEPYDAVMAWDVLEHVFDLEATMAHVAEVIRNGGWLLSKSTFADANGGHLHIHLAKHACYQDVGRFNQLVLPYGYRYVGQLKPNRLSRLLRAGGARYAVAGIRITPRLKHGGNFLVHERVIC